MLRLNQSSICHRSDDAASASDLCQLKLRASASATALSHDEHTFSCHPKSTLPLTSPHPGNPMPLYRYFISVSCASSDKDRMTPEISVALVLLRIVTSVCRFKFWPMNGQDDSTCRDVTCAPLPLPHSVRMVRPQEPWSMRPRYLL